MKLPKTLYVREENPGAEDAFFIVSADPEDLYPEDAGPNGGQVVGVYTFIKKVRVVCTTKVEE